MAALRDLELDLAHSVFVGDSPSDMQAGAAARVGACIMLRPVHEAASEEPAIVSADRERIVANMIEAR